MMMKKPPRTDPGVRREEVRKEPSSPPVLQVKRQPRLQERLPAQELRLTRNLLAKSPSSGMPCTPTLYVFKGSCIPGSFETGVQDEQAEEEVQHLPNWFQKPTRQPSPDHAWNTSVPAVHESVQPWLSNLAQQDPRESFDELTDSTFDFSAFVLNRLNVQTLTPELLAGPTFELMKGTCKSLTELEYFCEEVYKATTEKLDWINPEGRQYPHDLRQPLPLVPNSQGRRVIPFHHFINNDLEYLRGGVSSRKYSTSVTKTKAADYGHIKWIEDLVPISMWSQTIVKYDRSAPMGNLALGKEATTVLCICNLKGISSGLRRDDDALYTFKEGDFHRLRIQDIEDMLLLLVQGKVTNLSVEERIAFNVSLRISNLRRQDAYTPYLHPRGFITEHKDKKTAIAGALTNYTSSAMANARAMIQAIDKRLKTRRIMRSLERFVGGRPYGGDLRLLQRTI
ncbi:hypothetical protein Tco_0163117 [Tanacetum coccineum]